MFKGITSFEEVTRVVPWQEIKRGPTLVDFLLPTDDDRDLENPEGAHGLRLVKGNAGNRQKPDLYRKHVEELTWKAAGSN